MIMVNSWSWWSNYCVGNDNDDSNNDDKDENGDDDDDDDDVDDYDDVDDDYNDDVDNDDDIYDEDDDDDGAKTRYDICGIPPPVISPQFGWKQPIINCTPHPTLLSPQNTKIQIQLQIQIQIQIKINSKQTKYNN